MGNKFLRSILIVISSLAASVGMASCSIVIDGNTSTISDSTTIHNSTTDTTSDSSTGNHSHNYNQQVATDAYKVSNADCEHAATYYYSCSCGDIGIETFEYGAPLGHDWHYEYFQTSEEEYYQSRTCSRCDEKEKRTIQSVNNLSFAVTSEEEKNCTVTGYKGFYYDERDNYICIPKTWNDYKVTSIGEYAFKGHSSLSSIVIPDSVTSIGNYAFHGCSSLSSIVIPDSVTSIGGCAFGYCTSLSSIVIPDSVTLIGENAFWNCTSLSSIKVKEGNTVYDSREDCNAIIETSTNTLIAGCATTIIPDGVTSIGNFAFYSCYSLSTIVIPDSVTSIGNSAFYGCDSLSSIVIPDSVTSIGNSAFLYCSTSLTSIMVKEGNTVYDSREDCNAIIETSTNTLIAGCATTIIPDSVTSIGDGAFGGCFSLSTIMIPDRVTSIGDGAFYGCDSLSSIVIPDSVTSIGNSSFSYCTSLRSIVIPDSVTSIGNEVFEWCTSLGSVTIGNGVTSIGSFAFDFCTSLTSIVIPDSVTSIDDGAFSYCTSLRSIVIPDSVTSIGTHAFKECYSLSDVYYIGSEEQWNAISIDSTNVELKSVTIHYNYIGK